MSHAMNHLVGLPYLRGADGTCGPVDCWHLVRLACAHVHGVMPPLLAQAVAPVVRGASAQGWVRVADAPRPGDIVVMRAASGDRHTGFVVRARRRLELLHAVHGGSVCQPLDELPALGFHGFRTWRLTGAAHHA